MLDCAGLVPLECSPVRSQGIMVCVPVLQERAWRSCTTARSPPSCSPSCRCWSRCCWHWLRAASFVEVCKVSHGLTLASHPVTWPHRVSAGQTRVDWYVQQDVIQIGSLWLNHRNNLKIGLTQVCVRPAVPIYRQPPFRKERVVIIFWMWVGYPTKFVSNEDSRFIDDDVVCVLY